MSVQRALEVLGLSGSPSAEEVRRAYLRQVKQHPPERDREGFQLVREAYDCLKAVQAWVRLHEARAGTEPVALGDSAAAREPTSFEPASQPAPSALAPSEHAGPVLDEPSEPAPPEPAIALPDDVARDMQRLQQALDRDDPATAAEVMITLYSRPAHDGGPVPPPLFCLRTVMVLIERGSFEPALALLDAFEKYMASYQLASALGSDIGARWRLARETAAIVALDEPLAQAVARGLREGRLHVASVDAEAALARGEVVRRALASRAPTILAALGPWLEQAREEEQASRSRTSGGVSYWPLWALGILLFNVLRGCPTTGNSPSRYVEDVRPRVAVQEPESTSSPQVAAPPLLARETQELELPLGPPLSFRERGQRQVDAAWSSLHAALERGDCQSVADQWPLYRISASVDVVDMKTAAARKQEILRMCSELGPMLEEMP